MVEKTLLALRPTRLVAIHYYVTGFFLWILAALAWLNIWNVIPEWEVPFIGVQLKSVAASLLGFLGLLAILGAELKRLAIRYIVTDSRVIRRDGILRRRTEQMPFSKVERVELDQGVIQRILRIGDIVVDTGEDTIVLAALGRVSLIQDELSRQVTAHARRS